MPAKTCEALYGPYPKAVPIPYISKDQATPPSDVIANAKTIHDMKDHIDYRDQGTPDEWVPRDGRLVRLTGRHPFNVEPPIRELNKYKFITPSSLHYVRNHGAVPVLKWEEHTVEVNNGDQTLVASMGDLVNMPQRELPVTLVCAGNRRKEQNMMRQTIGFNWGPSGVSTNVWKGVTVRHLLQRVGITDDTEMDGKHVEFVGIEDLPNKVGPGPFEDAQWGKLVKYGTSVPLSRAMNPAFDILIAHEANGEQLQPDHGFPVRLIIPGYIGGRMIKWLAQINVLDYESKNHYHYHDNRILPPQITSEESLTGGWWYKPEYIFNELNINSAIARPDHNEMIDLRKDITKEFTMAGYAYTGGGRMITRVEISLDGGVHWELCEITRNEKPTPHGMYWCWTWWEYKLRVSDFIGAKEIWCRAWDAANMTQPTEPTWNLMGMGNNQCFRVKVHPDGATLKFEHPTQPGQETGGWMTKISGKPNAAGYGRLLTTLDNAEPEPVVAKASTTGAAKYTWEEINKEEERVLIVVNKRVYDCTEYLELHPGGEDSILITKGQDATEDFVAIHSVKATKMLEKYYIGELDVAGSKTAPADASEDDNGVCVKTGRKLALNPRKKTPFTLQNKIELSHDSFMLDFALPTTEHVLGLPTGKHMFFSANIDGETVLRRYTPISSDFDVGCVKFVIKAYKPIKQFPKGGKMSQYLDSLKIGDSLDMRGPVGEFHYLQNGQFTIDGEDHSAQYFNMVAGGTGITPCMQIAAEILRHPNDNTKVSLIFACRNENDLLMRSTLDEWEKQYPKKFQVHYILSDSWSDTWTTTQGYSTGFVNKALFEKQFYPPSSGCYNLMCGPPIMLERGCVPNMISLGHTKQSMFSF